MDTGLRFPQSSYDVHDVPGNTETNGERPGGSQTCCTDSLRNRVCPVEHNYLPLPPLAPTNELSSQTCSAFLNGHKYYSRLPVEFNQHSTAPPSQHYIQRSPVGHPPYTAAPENCYNGQYFSAAQPLWPAAPLSLHDLYGLPMQGFQQHAARQSLHGLDSLSIPPFQKQASPQSLQQTGLHSIPTQLFQQQATAESLHNICGLDTNISCEHPLPPSLGHDGNEIVLPLLGYYLPRSRNAHQTYEDSPALYGSHVASNSQVELRSATNAFETHPTHYRSMTDNYSEPSQVPAGSENLSDRLTTPSSQFQPSNVTNTFDRRPTSNYSMNNNRGQVPQTPAALQDLSDLITAHKNCSDWSAFESHSPREDSVIPILPSHIPNIATHAGGELVAPPIGCPRIKALKKKTQQKKRKAYTPSKQLMVNAMRKQGACWSCHANKKQCDFNTPCHNCQNNATAKIFNQPCCRDTVMDVVPFRQGNSRMGKTESKLPKLKWSHENTELRKVQLIYSFKIDDGRSRPVLPVECRQFIPDRDEVLKEEWQVDGQLKVLELPPYACFDRYGDMKDVVRNFMDGCKESMEETMLDATTDELLKLTIAEAIRYSKGPKGFHIDKALKIRAGAFLIASSFSMQGEENLGIEVCPDRTPSYFKYPLPTVLEYQIDTMAIDVMKGHQGTVLKHLKYLISKRKPREVWYEVFLLVFILLSTLEFVYQKQLDYVSWHQGTSQYTGVNYVASVMMKEWEHSAVNLITHFRFVLRAHTPFTKSWEQAKDNEIDDDSAAYLNRANELIQNRKSEFVSLKSSTAFRPFAWLSQLFLD